MNIITHKKIDKSLCGHPVELKDGFSRVELITRENMAADGYGLVHGGFIFGLADYGAMIAVNHPNVVLGGADVKFLKPVKVGEKVIATAEVKSVKGKKHVVEVYVERESAKVFEGSFICFVLDSHVLAS